MEITLQIDEAKTLDLTESYAAIDRLEEDMSKQDGCFTSLPVRHEFTDGLYTRQILIPAGTLLTSEIHLTQHPYFILMGKIAVWNALDGKWTMMEAPDRGITEPGTRRVLYAVEDTVWVTCHALRDGESNVEQIEARILDQEHRMKYHPQYLPERSPVPCPT